jgi:hypothetical protein
MRRKTSMARSRAFVLAGGLAVTGLVLSSCMTELSATGALVKEVDESAVAGCELVGKVEGTSGWEGLSSMPGITQGKNEALNDAANRGVTHVVWDPVSKGGPQSVTGRGFRCPTAGEPAAPK